MYPNIRFLEGSEETRPKFRPVQVLHIFPSQRRSGRKPGARVTNSARLFTPRKKDSIARGFKSGCHRRVGGHLTDLKNMDVYQEWKRQKLQQQKTCKKA